jgi:putative oxidoreductase
MWGRNESTAKDVGLLALRLTYGGLMAGHGAQKLFGAFGGYGLEGTAGWLESLGFKPGKAWAMLAGGGEFGSGVLTALGFLNPLGPIGAFGPMVMAWAKVHAGKPIWAASGGAELPLMNLGVATALSLVGPGRFSLDEAFGIEIPAPVIGLAAAGVTAGIIAGLMAQPAPPEPQANEAGGELQAGEDAGGSGADTALNESSVGS